MTYSVSIPNSEYGHLVPQEDAFHFNESVLCVADGITRDSGGNANTAGKTFIDLAPNYPNPSGARFAADTFCSSIARNLVGKSCTEEVAKQAFIAANADIAKLNTQQNPEVDYLANDYFACVASLVIREGSSITWGYIGDCGVAVFSASGVLKLKTPDGLSTFHRYLSTIAGSWSDPARRRFVRSEVRNNPNLIYEGKKGGYGALTGQSEAEEFMEFGSLNLEVGDLVVVYSDGFIDTVSRPDFFTSLSHTTASFAAQSFVPYTLNLARQDPRRYGAERTLIAYTYFE